MKCDVPNIIKIYLENWGWAKEILSLDDSLKFKGCNKVCYDVSHANLPALSNTVMPTKSA